MKTKAWLGRVGVPTLAGVLVFVLLVAKEAGFFRPTPAPHPSPAATRDGRWLQDIDYLASELPRLHCHLFARLTPSAFAAAVDSLRTDVPDLTDGQIRLRIAAIVASVGDGHTTLTGWTEGLPELPLRLRWFSDGLFITRVELGHEDLFGGEILKIGNADSEAAFVAVSRLMAADNESSRRSWSTRLLRNTGVLSLLGLISGPQGAMLRIQRQRGDTVDLFLPAAFGEVPWSPRAPAHTPLYRQQPEEPFWFRVLPETRTLFFKYNRCVDEGAFATVAQEVREAVEREGIRRVVVDFRGNGGGRSSLFSRHLLGFLREHEGLNREGGLYSVIDGGTFSSAVLNAVALERETLATTMGEPTGGRPNHFGEVRSFRLPNAELVVHYSTRYFEPFPALGDAPALVPEVLVPLSSQDYFRGSDPVMDGALRLPIPGVS